jgi:hypothetical protein
MRFSDSSLGKAILYQKGNIEMLENGPYAIFISIKINVSF